MVYVFLADGFEEIEALTPVDVLRRAGIGVKTVGVSGEYVTGAHGIAVKSDISAAEAEAESEEVEMIILPGGMPGAENLDRAAVVDDFIKRAVDSDAYLAAICAAPMILGKRGLLAGKSATCYPGFEKYLKDAVYYDAEVVADGNVLTANGMGAALDFALQAVALLKGEAESNRIAEAVMA